MTEITELYERDGFSPEKEQKQNGDASSNSSQAK